MSEVRKKYVISYEADVKSYVNGTEKISVATKRMAMNSKASAEEVEAAVSKSGLKNVKVYEESATTLARAVKAEIASNQKLVESHKKAAKKIAETKVAANDEAEQMAQKNSRRHRAIMQSAGYQLQDVMIQAQNNTSAWVIMSQQGSQFASSFGAIGTVIGAVIAIAGGAIPALLRLMGETTTSIDELNESTDELNTMFRKTSDGSTVLSEELARLYQESAKLGELQLFIGGQKLKSNMEETQLTIKALAADLVDLNSFDFKDKDPLSYKFGVDAGISETNLMDARIDALSEKFGIATNEAKTLNKAFADFNSSGDVIAFGESLSGIAEVSPDASKELVDLSQTILDYSKSLLSYEELQNKFNNAIKSGGKATKDYNQIGLERLRQEQAKTLALRQTSDEQEIYNFAMFEAIGFSDTMTYKIVAEMKKRHDLAYEIDRETEALKRQEKASDDRLKGLDKTSKAIDKVSGKKVETHSPYSAFGDVVKLEQQGKAIEGIMSNIDNAWADAVASGDTDTMEHMLSPEWIAKEKELQDASLANDDAFAKSKQELLDQVVEGQVAQAEQLASTLLSAADEGSAAYKALFVIQQGFAIATGTIQALNQAALAKSAVMTAYGPTAAALPAGQAAYDLTLGLGMLNVGATAGVAFAGAFDKGGSIPNNQMGIVSEFGDELVGGTLVYNQSGGPLGVTGREKTASMMSEGDNGQTYLNVVQNFNINGNPDKSAVMQMKQMAKGATMDAYRMVQKDFKNDKGVAKRVARR